MDLAEFTAALSRAITASGLNQSEVARATNGVVSQGTISTWRSGGARPNPESVFAVEQALGLSPGHLSRHLGYMPVAACDACKTGHVNTLAAIESDPALDEEGRGALTLLYQVLTSRAAKRAANTGRAAEPAASA